MTTILKVAADFIQSLSSSVNEGYTTATLSSAADAEGNALSAGTYGFTIDNNSPQKEYIVADLSGTALTNVQSISRQGVATVGFSNFHRKGAAVEITDWSALYRVDAVLSGQAGLDNGSPIYYGSAPALGSPNELATVQYVLDNVNGGAVSFNAEVIAGMAGETIASGDWVYLDTSDGRWYKTDADYYEKSIGVKLGKSRGIGTSGNAISGGVFVQGLESIGTYSANTTYYLSNTAGALATSAGTFSVVVGTTDANGKLIFNVPTLPLTPILTGMIFPYASSTAPSGYLVCDGSNYYNNSYPGLVGVLKGNYGVGTGTTFTANDATDTFTAVSHGMSAGQILLVSSTNTLPTGLSANTLYYVINVTTNTFQLSASLNGSAINITTAGTGTLSYYTQFSVPDLRGRAIIGSGTGTKVATFVSRASNVVTVTDITNAANNEFQTGEAVVYHTTGTVMTGLTNDATYYIIRTGNLTFSLASSLANAQNGTVIALSSDGSGTQTFTHTFTERRIGNTGGEENHAISLTELIAHTHPPLAPNTNFYGSGSGSPSGSGSSTTGVATTGSSGGNAAMNIMQPFSVAAYIIKT